MRGRRRPRKLVEALSPEERRRLVSCFRDDGERLTVGLMLYAGLRASEALDLTWDDVRLGDRMLFIRRGKGSKQRWVPIAAPLLPLLAGGAEGPVLRSRSGGRLPERTLRYRVKRLGERAGIPWLHPHILRHTCATEVLRATHDLEVVRRLLGHTNIQTTVVYTDLLVEDIQEAVDGVDWC